MTKDEIARRCRDAMWENDRASQAMGMEVQVVSAGHASATLTVREDMANGWQICHGGFIFALADSAFAFACNSYDRVTVASNCTVDFLKPAKVGDTLTAVATERHRGGRTGVYDVTVTNQNDEQIALFRGRSYATAKSIL
ncbi:MAG: hydroxyphenylacetyl-CoA thioesterase PaaI [Myxococcota bacterium]